MTQASDKKEVETYASTIYQLLRGVENPVNAVGRARASWTGPDSGFRSILRAAGAFARDNDGYFIRYERDARQADPLPLPDATHLFVFPVPVEPRMRVAYSYVQGIFLKYLYARYGAVPREVRQGWSEVVCGERKPLPDANQLWAEFLADDIAKDAIEVSAPGWILPKSKPGGRQIVDDTFMSETYLLGLVQSISENPSKFQWQLYQMPAFYRKDLPSELADREVLLTQNDPEAQEFRKNNRDIELNTFQVYEWLEKESWKTSEFCSLVDNALQAVETGDEGREISLIPAAEKLADMFRQQFVPLSSRDEYTKLAIPQITLYLLLWALVSKSPQREGKRMTLRGWDLALLRGVLDRLTAAKRGALMFTEKEYSKSGTSTLVKFAGYDKLESELRYGPESHDIVMAAPFELWNLGESQVGVLSSESHRETCLVCGKHGKTTRAKILPEREKRHYDSPQRDENAEVCARCVQVWSLAPISTADDSYAIVEVPVENFLELFALYESLEGISRLETLKTLNRVSSLSVFPNKYLLLSRSTGKGKLPQTAQYYLQLARQWHFVERLGNLEEDLEVIAVQDRAKLAREVVLTLSTLQQLPYYYASKSEEKVPAMSMINALDRGRPYEALYVAATQAHEAGRRETQAIEGGIRRYDEEVFRFGEFFARRQKGVGVSREIFRDVRTFSDYLYKILKPIVREEVKGSGSSVSGVARKYTENITKSFVRVNTADFLYRISSFVEGRERQNPEKDGWIKWTTRNIVHGESGTTGEPDETQPELKLEQELERYYEQYSGNQRDWKTFLEEVEARTLALLLLNVPNKRGN